MKNDDAFRLRGGDHVRVLPRALCAVRIGVGTVLTVATVDGPRFSPWIETIEGGRVAPWEVAFAARTPVIRPFGRGFA